MESTSIAVQAFAFVRQYWLHLIGAYVLWGYFYSFFLHPLARYPGPTAAHLTRFYWLRLLLSGKEHIKTKALHEKYGPIVRISPHALSVSDYRAVKIIYGRGPNAFPKGGQFGGGFSKDGEPPVFFAKSSKDHQMARKRINQTYTMTSILQMEHSLMELIKEFCREVEGRKVVDWCEWTSHLTFDMISQLGYGNKFGFMAKGGDVDGYEKALHSGGGFFSVLSTFWELNYLFEWVQQLAPLPESDEGIGHLLSKAKRLINSRMAHPTDTKDLLNGFLSSKRPDGTPLKHGTVVGEVMATLIAGADTTASAIQGTTIQLLKHPEVMSKLVAEIDRAKKEGRLSSPPKYTESLKLPYLVCVIKESLRLSPSISAIFARECPEPTIIVPGTPPVPAGTQVGMNNWVFGRNKELYGPDAEEFIPERWERANAKDLEGYEFAFGHGNRVCIGRNLAMVELHLFFVEVLSRYNLKWEDGGRSLTETSGLFLFKSGLMVRAEKRV